MEAKRMTDIGEIPEKWVMVRLGDEVKINRESRDPKREFPDEKFHYIDIESVEGGTGIIRTTKEILGKDAPSRARRVVHQNDIIMSTVRPYLRAFALVSKDYNNQICSTGFAVLSCRNEIIPLYLLYTLFSKDVIEQCNKMMMGGQYPALNRTQVSKIKIPLPPLPEQRRIAEVLGTVDSAIQKVGGAIERTERLKRGLMQQLLTRGIGHERFKETKVGRVPEEWRGENFSNIIKLSSGKTRPSEITNNSNQKMKFPIYGGNGILGYSDKYNINKEVIVIGRVGEYCGAVHKTSKFSWISDNALYTSEILNPELDLDYLKCYLIYLNLNRFKKKSGQPLMTQEIIYSINILLPPLPEQHRIAEILSTVDKKLELERTRKEKLERVKKGLMNELLTGRKRMKVD